MLLNVRVLVFERRNQIDQTLLFHELQLPNYRLWVSDGAMLGTFQVAGGAGGTPLHPTQISPYGARIVFTASGGLWLNNGSSGLATDLTPVGASFPPGALEQYSLKTRRIKKCNALI